MSADGLFGFADRQLRTARGALGTGEQVFVGQAGEEFLQRFSRQRFGRLALAGSSGLQVVPELLADFEIGHGRLVGTLIQHTTYKALPSGRPEAYPTGFANCELCR